MRYLLLLLVVLPFCSLKAQDRMLLMNCKTIDSVKVVDISANTVTYLRQGSLNEHKIYRENIFAITYKDGKEKVLYMPAPEDNDLDIEQMRMFINGTRKSKVSYHNYSSYLIGFAAGIAGPVFAKSTGILSLAALPPATGIFLASLGSPKMSNLSYIDKKYLNNEEYMMGFQRKARAKKIRNAFFGSLVGVAAMSVYMISQN